MLVIALLSGRAEAQPRQDVCVILAGWDGVVTPEQVREALAMRLPGRKVSVCEEPPADACRVELHATSPEWFTLTVACDADQTLRDRVPKGPPGEVARRVAVEAAALLGGVPDAPPDPPRAPPAPTAIAAAKPEPAPDTTVHVGAGAAVAPELPGATFALVVDVRWFAWQNIHLNGGGKLAGAFENEQGGQTVSAADRGFWLGAGYRRDLSRAFIDVALAGQYTLPFLEAGDDSMGDPTEDSKASRFSLRAAAQLGWRFDPSLAAVLATAASMSFVERDVSLAGRDALEIGTAVFDVVAGFEVGF